MADEKKTEMQVKCNLKYDRNENGHISSISLSISNLELKDDPFVSEIMKSASASLVQLLVGWQIQQDPNNVEIVKIVQTNKS